MESELQRSSSARSLYEEGLSLFRELGDARGISQALSSLGNVACLQGDYLTSRIFLEESLDCLLQAGDRYVLAWVWNGLGKTARAQGDAASAQTHFEEGLRLFQELDNREGVAWSFCSLGDLALDRSDLTRAQSFYLQSLKLFRDLQDRRGLMRSLCSLAKILGIEGSEPRNIVLWWSAAETLQRIMGLPLSAIPRTIPSTYLEQARQALGEEAFAAVWEEGQRLPWEQIVAEVLDETS